MNWRVLGTISTSKFLSRQRNEQPVYMYNIIGPTNFLMFTGSQNSLENANVSVESLSDVLADIIDVDMEGMLTQATGGAMTTLSCDVTSHEEHKYNPSEGDIKREDVSDGPLLDPTTAAIEAGSGLLSDMEAMEIGKSC